MVPMGTRIDIVESEHTPFKRYLFAVLFLVILLAIGGILAAAIIPNIINLDKKTTNPTTPMTTTSTTSTPTTTRVDCNKCSQTKLDLLLVLDESGSVGQANFNLMKQASIDLVQQLNIQYQ